MHAILSRGLVGALRTNAPSPAAGNRISLHQNPGASTLDKTRIWRRSRFVMLASQYVDCMVACIAWQQTACGLLSRIMAVVCTSP